VQSNFHIGFFGVRVTNGVRLPTGPPTQVN